MNAAKRFIKFFLNSVIINNDEDLLCIALLHDVMEDCNVSADDLYNQGFSKRVVEAVTCMTRIDGETLDDYKNRVKSNTDAVLIKLCDLEHNMDLSRLKHVSEKDYNRNLKYQEFHNELKDSLDMILYNELTKNFKY